METKIDYSIISIPLNTKPLKRTDFCYFCKKKSENVFVVQAEKGSKIICLKCKRTVEKENKNNEEKPLRENVADGRVIFHGGLPFTNPRKF